MDLTVSIENIGGKSIQYSHSEKLLGLHINSNFEWSTHIDKISIELKKRIGLLTLFYTWGGSVNPP